VLYPDRVSKRGVPFHLTTPDFVVSNLELENGVVVRLTTDFYVANATTRQRGIEFHGDLGSLHIEAWQDFDSKVYFAPFNQPFEEMPLIREASHGTPWGRGVWEMVTAIQAGRPHRFTGEQGAHVTEILGAAAQSLQTGSPVEIHSSFTPPPPMEWAT
jgi:predicted dehydrogenase